MINKSLYIQSLLSFTVIYINKKSNNNDNIGGLTSKARCKGPYRVHLSKIICNSIAVNGECV